MWMTLVLGSKDGGNNLEKDWGDFLYFAQQNSIEQ